MLEYKFKLLLPLIFYLIQNSSEISRIDPLVNTKVGLIRGLRATDGDYSMFMGIPYATVNESNPFGVSIPHPGFDETFEAYDDSAICPQIEEFNNTIVGSLDCLHINIYVPNSANAGNRLPVFVWIYGGGFSIGFSGRYLYGPRYIVKQDVILVTFNYRLGAYGFMCLNTPDIPGNQGLKDQRLALKWIKDNIESFGGNSDKITIAGESAGGATVDFHLIYSQEKIFDKVIMQSGAAISPWAVLEPDILAPLKLSKHLGFVTTDIKEALSFLTIIEPKLIIESTSELDLLFRPCVEEEFNNVERFVHDYPVNIKTQSLGNVSIVLGYNRDEALGTYEVMTQEEYANLNVFYDDLKNYFIFTDKSQIEMETLLRHFYIGDEKISEQVKQGLIEFESDFRHIYPMVRTMQNYLNSGAKSIYYYMFLYDGERNFVKDRFNITAAGVTHADEIGYLFDISYMNPNPSPEDKLIIDRITTLWTNFVKFGNPTPKTSELLPVQWPAVSKDVLHCMHIDSELTIRKRPLNARMAFWDLFYKFNEKAQLGYRLKTIQKESLKQFP